MRERRKEELGGQKESKRNRTNKQIEELNRGTHAKETNKQYKLNLSFKVF
jgi:hypothetical protein